MKNVIYIIALILCTQYVCANDSIPNSTQERVQESLSLNEDILKYQQFLREETKQHREFTQEYYNWILKIFAFLGIAVGAIMTWLNWKSKESIKKQVNEQFKETVEEIINSKIGEIDNIIKHARDKSDRQFKDINKLLLELSKKSQGDNQDSANDNNANGLKNKEVLWVDDYPENNDYPRRILQEAGVRFVLALSTEDAMNNLKDKKFDLIISDMGRGNNGKAGIDLLGKLKEQNITIPSIIFASPQAIRSYGDEAKSLGAIATITGHSTLLNIIQKVLK